jgi:hypothetical protein
LLYFHPEDIFASISIAEVFKHNGIDLWLTSARLQSQIRALNNDVFPSQYQASSMTSEGYIVPATVWSLGADKKVAAFDPLNPAAMNWFLRRYKETILKPMAPYTTGYFFNEDCLYYGLDAGHQNNNRIDYWDLPAYSDSVLQAWQSYCTENSVTYEGQPVSMFPVHREAMVQKGAGKTKYFPGYEVPAVVPSGTRLVSIPRNTGVWAAWDNFLTTLYVQSWIGGIARAVYEVNRSNPKFKGVIYFGLHDWSLSYEEVVDPTFSVDSINKWVPWGTQRGVRLSRICDLPSIDYVICETYPPIKANLVKFALEFRRIAAQHNKAFGLMVHRDDSWGLDEKDTEADRWGIIRELLPTVIARYPISRLLPGDPRHDEVKEQLFNERLREYRK